MQVGPQARSTRYLEATAGEGSQENDLFGGLGNINKTAASRSPALEARHVDVAFYVHLDPPAGLFGKPIYRLLCVANQLPSCFVWQIHWPSCFV